MSTSPESSHAEGFLAGLALSLGTSEQQRFELTGDGTAGGIDAVNHRRPVGLAQVHAQPGSVGRLRRNRMLLLVANHLHGVLRLSQHQIGIGQLGHILGRQ